VATNYQLPTTNYHYYPPNYHQPLDDMRVAEEVQREVWQASDDELFSAHSLHALAYNGASLLGAYDNGRLVGLVLGTLATREGRDRPLNG
jgi:predicted GNAT superfamily acetyltransferase